jgi:cation:H+ antiporter
MQVFLPILYILIALGLLYYGAEWLVRGGSGVALKLKISRLVIGLTLVAFATSAPELTVSLDSALRGLDGLSLGNVIGSNICNIALILGLSALVAPIAVNTKLLHLEIPLMIVASIILTAFCYYFSGVTRIGGIVFLVLMAGFLWWQFRQARSGQEMPALADEVPESVDRPVWQWLLLALAGLAALVAGGKLFVTGAVALARLLHVSEAVIGLTVVAVGTSRPELATSLVAAIKGEQDIAIGNVVGSNIFNILCILGITATIKPLAATGITAIDLSTMLTVSILLPPMMLTGRKITRAEGAVLLVIYVVYTALLVKNALPSG